MNAIPMKWFDCTGQSSDDLLGLKVDAGIRNQTSEGKEKGEPLRELQGIPFGGSRRGVQYCYRQFCSPTKWVARVAVPIN